jgi:hypothetical protein
MLEIDDVFQAHGSLSHSTNQGWRQLAGPGWTRVPPLARRTAEGETAANPAMAAQNRRKPRDPARHSASREIRAFREALGCYALGAVNALALALLAASPGSDPGPVPTSTTALVALLLQPSTEADRATEERFAAAPLEAEEPTVTFGGALRFNFSWNTWQGEAQFPSASSFDVFRLDIGARFSELVLSTQYRFYAGYSMLQHGYIGTELDEAGLAVQLGVTQVPFGILPYASHSFFFGLTYYVGLEDDYDLGIKAQILKEPVEVYIAFFKNDEGNYSGSSLDSARYSYDLVRTRAGDLSAAGIEEARSLQETNQVNARAAVTISGAEGYATEIGASVQVGQTYEEATQFRRQHVAFAGHVEGDYGWLNVQLEGGYYDIGLDDRVVEDARLVAMGAYDAPYAVAAEAAFAVANVALEIPVDLWVLRSVTVYNDFSALLKIEDSFADSYMNTTGMLIVAGPIYTYVDAVAGRNHPWIGPDYVRALGPGNFQDAWELRFNVNLGWYF